MNKADCGIDIVDVTGYAYGLEGVFFVGESVGNDGGTGAVIETKPSFPPPDSETPDPRRVFVGDGLCVRAGGKFKIQPVSVTFSIGCRGKGDGSN